MADTFLQVTGFDPLVISEPQGPPGPQGQPGIPGPQGPPGGVNSVDGQQGDVSLSTQYAGLSAGKISVGVVPDLSGSYVALGADSTVTGHVSIERPYAAGDYSLKVGTGAARGAPTDAIMLATGGAGPLTGVYKYVYTDTDLVGETTPGASASYTASAEGIQVTIPLPRPGTVARNVYRTSAGGSDYKLVWSFGGGYDSHQTQFVDTMTDASRGVAAPATDTTQSWSLLSQPDGLTYVSGSPSTPTADDFALLIADGRQGTSWCIDSYGPIVTRTALGTNFVAYHTGTVGAAFQAFYTPTLCPVQGGATPQQTLIANGGGGLSIYQRAGASSALDVEGFGNALAIRAAIGDVNPTFWIDGTGKASYGPGGGSTTDVNFYRKAAGIVGTDYRLAVGNASGTSGTLTVGPGPNDAGVPTFKVTSAGGTFNVTVAAAGGTTLAVTGGTAFAFNQGPTTRLAFSTAGSVLVGAGAPALTATDGFPYLPANAGAPTGTPTTQSGFVPFYYDTTNHKLWIYDAGWKGVVVS